MKLRLLLTCTGLVLSALNSQLSIALAQGTAFTCQGRLNDGSSPANGSYDLTFALFGAGSGGAVLAGPLTNSATAVSNGLFTVTLDFGAGVFSGAARWLEIGVRTNGGGVFATLSPRQALTPLPYAIFAGNASVVAAGSVVQSLNTLKDDVRLAAGTNVTITPSGNTLTIAAAGVGGSGIWSVLNNNAYYNAGNVGIGTANPLEKLTLAGVTSFNTGLKVTGSSPNGTGMALENTASGGHKFDFISGGANDGIGAGAFGLYDETAAGYRLAIATNGNVGIGSTAPASKLDIVAAQDALSLIGYEPFMTFKDTGAGNARSRIAGGNGHVTLQTESYIASGDPANGYLIVRSDTGKVGIGSMTPESKLDIVAAQDALSLIGYQPFLTLKDTGAGYARSRVAGGDGHVSLQTEHYIATGDPAFGYLIVRNDTGNVGIGTGTPQARLDVVGTTRTCALTITGGCDLAEPFPLESVDIPKGAVVVIDKEHPGKLKRSTQGYDKRVAGIVSGANGIHPGISLQQEGVLAGGQNVALSGRVYVLADSMNGVIEPGDLLTTSDTPGYAMKVTDYPRAQGAVLGKAMSGLSEGKGLVLVLVTLQ